MNKASADDGIPVELFQILKDDAVKVLHPICQQIWNWGWILAKALKAVLGRRAQGGLAFLPTELACVERPQGLVARKRKPP